MLWNPVQFRLGVRGKLYSIKKYNIMGKLPRKVCPGPQRRVDEKRSPKLSYFRERLCDSSFWDWATTQLIRRLIYGSFLIRQMPGCQSYAIKMSFGCPLYWDDLWKLQHAHWTLSIIRTAFKELTIFYSDKDWKVQHDGDNDWPSERHDTSWICQGWHSQEVFN